MTGLVSVAPDVETVFARLAEAAGEAHHADTRRL
jgi:hypothetical protein